MSYDYKQIALARADLMSANLGDEIIMSYIRWHLIDLFPNCIFNSIPTQMKLDSRARKVLERSQLNFVCGTNLVASNMRTRKQWNVNLSDTFIKNKFILIGVGWWQYQDKPDAYTRFLFKHLLSSDYIHSVRDEYTKNKFIEAGITNVINTGCPTMWKLTSDFCREIPCAKADSVVFTLTDYKKSPENDKQLIRILKENYNRVSIWIQNDDDYSYLSALTKMDEIEIIPPSLTAYDSFLKANKCDYVGTRLHGGIRALNYRKRTIILAVDNRAKEIGNDTGLQVLDRENIEKLPSLIQAQWETNIRIPEDNIRFWKEQFI